jgi:hypothetical protein
LQAFLLDAVDNLPHLRISDSLMKVFLWVLHEAGVPDVPSFASLCEIQSHLRTEFGIPTHQYKSAQGNIYFMNNLKEIVAKTCDLFRIDACV